MIKKIFKHYFPYHFATKCNSEITFLCNSATKKKHVALLSYILAPFQYKDQNSCKAEHANFAAAWEIVYILNELGYDVDVVEASNKQYSIEEEYDLVIGTLDCIERFSPFLPTHCKKIFYALGVYVDERNGLKGELGRVLELEKRTGGNYIPKRLFPNPELIKRSVEKADAVIITGGEATINSFPNHILKKSIPCTMPIYPETIPKIGFLDINNATEFLWFFGFGQVHKGLDLVIEAFEQTPEFTLNIIGMMEDDFYKIYGSIIERSPNIIYHGFMDTSGDAFKNVISKCFSFIAPSVNEGISCACATLLQLGLYPIISRETGIDLPKNTGFTLEENTIKHIMSAIQMVSLMDRNDLIIQLSKLQEFSISAYSPAEFKKQFSNAIKAIISADSELIGIDS